MDEMSPKNKKRYSRSVLAGLLAAVLLLGACSGDDDSGTDDAAQATDQATEQATETSGEALEAAEAASVLSEDLEAGLEAPQGLDASKAQKLGASTVAGFDSTEPSPIPVVSPVDGVPAPDPTEVAQDAGVLNDLVTPQVGDYVLGGQEIYQPSIDGGAREAVALTYVNSAAAQASHIIDLWGDAGTAAAVAVARSQKATELGWTSLGSMEITGSDGAAIGMAYAYSTPDGLSAVIWNNLNIACIVVAEDAIDFFNNLTY